MERKYFIRTKDFCEIISDENYVKIITGEWSKFGEEEIIDKTDVKNFEDKEQQKQYFNEKVNYYSNNGYVECERANLVGLVDSDIDFYDTMVKEEDKIALWNLIENIKNKKHIALETWFNVFEFGFEFILDYFIENKNKYEETEYFTFGNMNFEICELSWITQSNYEKFFKVFSNIKGVFTQGSESLKLGKMNLPKLEILELQGSGLDCETLEDITNSNLPNLKRLNLYFGVEYYGCDVEIDYVKNLLNNTNFEKLEILGLCNIDYNLFSDVLKLVFESKYAKQIKVLDISKSCSTDRDAQYIIDNIKKLENINYIDISFNYFSNNMIKELIERLKVLNISIDLNNENNFMREDMDLKGFDFGEDSCPMYTE